MEKMAIRHHQTHPDQEAAACKFTKQHKWTATGLLWQKVAELTDLARFVQRKDLGPDEDQGLAQQLEHIREDANGQGQVHRPAAHVQKAPQQHQSSLEIAEHEGKGRVRADLQNNGQLLRWRCPMAT
ncbi:MAG: hypothetical protein FRX49_09983 [Trebouxia sp. A1-2]|nr:MAG: hypothetical protein FRX49_09983 [Trebouxia sp. A1-2]